MHGANFVEIGKQVRGRDSVQGDECGLCYVNGSVERKTTAISTATPPDNVPFQDGGQNL